MLNELGLKSVAAPGFEAPGVVVYYSPNDLDNGAAVGKFKEVRRFCSGLPPRFFVPLRQPYP